MQSRPHGQTSSYRHRESNPKSTLSKVIDDSASKTPLRMTPRLPLIAADISTLVDDSSDVARAEIKRSVDAEHRTCRTAISCAAEPLYVSQLLLRV